MLSPEQQAADYRAQGYDFLALTDHNIMKTHVQFNSDDFLMIPGWERDIPYGTTKCLHVVGLFPSDTPDDSVITRPRGNPDVMSQQQLIDQMRSENVFVEIAHPIWSRMEPEELRALQGFNAIEIFNTGTERLCHAGHAEVYWDMLLREGRHVTGIACDDTHGKTAKSDRFFGWVMVRAEALTREAILRALCAGDFYASQGPAFSDCYVEDDHLHIECTPCEEIHIITYPPRGKAVYALDKPLTELDYPLKGAETYVRVECIDHEGRTAWSNPIWM